MAVNYDNVLVSSYIYLRYHLFQLFRQRSSRHTIRSSSTSTNCTSSTTVPADTISPPSSPPPPPSFDTTWRRDLRTPRPITFLLPHATFFLLPPLSLTFPCATLPHAYSHPHSLHPQFHSSLDAHPSATTPHHMNPRSPPLSNPTPISIFPDLPHTNPNWNKPNQEPHPTLLKRRPCLIGLVKMCQQSNNFVYKPPSEVRSGLADAGSGLATTIRVRGGEGHHRSQGRGREKVEE